MEQNYVEGKTFHKIDFTQKHLEVGEYEDCQFIACDFSNSSFANIKFIDCKFQDCNLSMVILNGTALRDISFVHCKMLGLRFESCNKFFLSVNFDHCNLNHSSFYQVKIKKTAFKNSQLHEADFTEADLSASVFENCDLLHATFDGTNIESADLRSSFNYIIDPDNNRIKKAKFSSSGLSGLLVKYDIEIE